MERFEVRLAGVIDESAFISEVGRVYAQREEILLRTLLYLLFVVISIIRLIHIEQVTHSELIIHLAPSVPILIRKHFTHILQNKCTSRNGL